MARANDVLEHLARRVGDLLRTRGWSLATAESCTGGLVSHAITNIAGSSSYYVGGVVAYDNSIKERLLGVSGDLLAAHGAVSREVALAMALGVCGRLGAQVGVATTGIAGPSGGTPTKPVGTVFVAVASPFGSIVRHHRWDADRITNKELSAQSALQMLVEVLDPLDPKAQPATSTSG